MDIFEAAKRIDGREYRSEVSKELAQELKENRLVAVFGYSDDVMVFEGAINDEFYETTYVTKDGVLENSCEDDDCPYFAKLKKSAKMVVPKWAEEDGISWIYETEIPHATFNIMEDGDIYCRGIVFSLDNL